MIANNQPETTVKKTWSKPEIYLLDRDTESIQGGHTLAVHEVHGGHNTFTVAGKTFKSATEYNMALFS